MPPVRYLNLDDVVEDFIESWRKSFEEIQANPFQVRDRDTRIHPNHFYTTREAAKFLGIDPAIVTKYIERGLLTPVNSPYTWEKDTTFPGWQLYLIEKVPKMHDSKVLNVGELSALLNIEQFLLAKLIQQDFFVVPKTRHSKGGVKAKKPHSDLTARYGAVDLLAAIVSHERMSGAALGISQAPVYQARNGNIISDETAEAVVGRAFLPQYIQDIRHKANQEGIELGSWYNIGYATRFFKDKQKGKNTFRIRSYMQRIEQSPILIEGREYYPGWALATLLNEPRIYVDQHSHDVARRVLSVDQIMINTLLTKGMLMTESDCDRPYRTAQEHTGSPRITKNSLQSLQQRLIVRNRQKILDMLEVNIKDTADSLTYEDRYIGGIDPTLSEEDRLEIWEGIKNKFRQGVVRNLPIIADQLGVNLRRQYSVSQLREMGLSPSYIYRHIEGIGLDHKKYGVLKPIKDYGEDRFNMRFHGYSVAMLVAANNFRKYPVFASSTKNLSFANPTLIDSIAGNIDTSADLAYPYLDRHDIENLIRIGKLSYHYLDRLNHSGFKNTFLELAATLDPDSELLWLSNKRVANSSVQRKNPPKIDINGSALLSSVYLDFLDGCIKSLPSLQENFLSADGTHFDFKKTYLEWQIDEDHNEIMKARSLDILKLNTLKQKGRFPVDLFYGFSILLYKNMPNLNKNLSIEDACSYLHISRAQLLNLINGGCLNLEHATRVGQFASRGRLINIGNSSIDAVLEEDEIVVKKRSQRHLIFGGGERLATTNEEKLRISADSFRVLYLALVSAIDPSRVIQEIGGLTDELIDEQALDERIYKRLEKKYTHHIRTRTRRKNIYAMTSTQVIGELFPNSHRNPRKLYHHVMRYKKRGYLLGIPKERLINQVVGPMNRTALYPNYQLMLLDLIPEFHKGFNLSDMIEYFNLKDDSDIIKMERIGKIVRTHKRKRKSSPFQYTFAPNSGFHIEYKRFHKMFLVNTLDDYTKHLYRT
ncbi:MAG: hypothetical protein V1859_05970 [archaeon]